MLFVVVWVGCGIVVVWLPWAFVLAVWLLIRCGLACVGDLLGILILCGGWYNTVWILCGGDLGCSGCGLTHWVGLVVVWCFGPGVLGSFGAGAGW